MKEKVDYNKVVDAMIADFWKLDNLKNFSEEDLSRIHKAYEFAKEAHSHQKRKSGEPYIIHPISVARIAAEEFGMESDTIIACFLHDVVEDTHYTIEDIEEHFGKMVAFLVAAVTKEHKEKYEMSKQVDNFRQMLNAINYDIRALLVKLADRLHNMRTLSSMRPDKQMKIAGETDYFYAPLANRLGMHDVRVELSNLSMQYRCPDEYKDLNNSLDQYRLENEESIIIWCEGVREHLASYGIEARVEPKFRSIHSLWYRMNKNESDFRHLPYKYIVNISIPVPAVNQEKSVCLQIYSALTDKYKEMPNSLHNYIDNPKENGYQALHINILNGAGEWAELHITSERMLHNSKIGCLMERRGGVQTWLDKFKVVLQDLAEHKFEGGFLENVMINFYKDDIYVFTPKEDGIVLPAGATALDFAFEIHKEIGLRAYYAHINGELSSIKTELKRGDCVLIHTSDEITPQADWLDYIKTYKARKVVSAYIRKDISKCMQGFELCKICHPLPGDEVVGFAFEKVNVLHKRNCIEAVRLASENGDNIIEVDFRAGKCKYLISVNVRAVDRFHLLSDILKVVTDELRLSIGGLDITTNDFIVDCKLTFEIKSVDELRKIIEKLESIDGVDEVKRVVNEK